MNTTDPQLPETTPTDPRPYSEPQIIHELDLETRAGSPTGILPDPLDPLGLQKK